MLVIQPIFDQIRYAKCTQTMDGFFFILKLDVKSNTKNCWTE